MNGVQEDTPEERHAQAQHLMAQMDRRDRDRTDHWRGRFKPRKVRDAGVRQHRDGIINERSM